VETTLFIVKAPFMLLAYGAGILAFAVAYPIAKLAGYLIDISGLGDPSVKI